MAGGDIKHLRSLRQTVDEKNEDKMLIKHDRLISGFSVLPAAHLGPNADAIMLDLRQPVPGRKGGTATLKASPAGAWVRCSNSSTPDHRVCEPNRRHVVEHRTHKQVLKCVNKEQGR